MEEVSPINQDKLEFQDIMKTDWDMLIILDACRYDYFKKYYKEILGDKGSLKCVISPATETMEWLNKQFSGKQMKDVVYISSNPFINSKMQSKENEYTFDAKKHFFKVMDVWEYWDDAVSTVHPKEVNKAVVVANSLYRNKRFIIHYMQPHQPYIYYGSKSVISKRGPINKPNTIRSKIIKIFSNLASKIFSQETIWKIGKTIKINPEWGMGKLWLKYGKKGIIKGYTEDLKLVLKYAKKIIDRYPNKKIVITADHGEQLGEKGNYGHGGKKRVDELIKVPWWTN